jgi:hypothetical protein
LFSFCGFQAITDLGEGSATGAESLLLDLSGQIRRQETGATDVQVRQEPGATDVQVRQDTGATDVQVHQEPGATDVQVHQDPGATDVQVCSVYY